MATTYTRPSGAYTSTSTTTNANKYQTDSGASTAISSAKIDGDVNQLIDAVNQLGLDIDSVTAGALPSQTGNTDKVITTNGTVASWALVDTANIATDAVTTVKVSDGNITEAKLATSAVTTTKLASDAVTTVKIINDAVTTAKILDNNVTLAKLNDGTAQTIIGYSSTGAPEEKVLGTALTSTDGSIDLDNTAVTPASYTNTNITVDQQGRITSASNGTAPTTVTTFTSAEQTITAGGDLTLPHGLGGLPLGVTLYAICKVSEGGWSVGATCMISQGMTHGGNYGVQCNPTTGNMYLQYGTSGIVLQNTSNTSIAITPANWKLIVKAWIV